MRALLRNPAEVVHGHVLVGLDPCGGGNSGSIGALILLSPRGSGRRNSLLPACGWTHVVVDIDVAVPVAINVGIHFSPRAAGLDVAFAIDVAIDVGILFSLRVAGLDARRG
jgi:hypothetical protein